MTTVCEETMLPGMVPYATQMTATVVEQVRLARDTYRLRLAAPGIAAAIVPGQFVMLRPAGTTVPLLGRPFALWDVYHDGQGQPAGIDIVYLVVGRMTSLMPQWAAGDAIEVWGPLGNGFPVATVKHLLLVGGGIGHTPFLAVGKEALGRQTYGRAAPKNESTRPEVTFLYGVRSAEYLAGVEEFVRAGLQVEIATNDGSYGRLGFVTELLAEKLSRLKQEQGVGYQAATAIYCCGPEPMMHAVAQVAAKGGVDCWLSLETPMACGFGACFSCVTKVRQAEDGWDYRRVCVEGPVFRAADLAW